jgi:hypothetical protein
MVLALNFENKNLYFDIVKFYSFYVRTWFYWNLIQVGLDRSVTFSAFYKEFDWIINEIY